MYVLDLLLKDSVGEMCVALLFALEAEAEAVGEAVIPELPGHFGAAVLTATPAL